MNNSVQPDLAAYFQRIGYSGPQTATRDVLAAIVLRHVQSIPFENLDAFLGRGVSLRYADVEHKLLHARRGGWCFEQNLLLGSVLRALGFEVTDLAARVVWGRDSKAEVARTHRLLRVVVAGQALLADVGFGGQTLTGVIEMDGAEAQPTPHEPFRLQTRGAELLLESQIDGTWLPLYRFSLEPQLNVDYEAANFQLAHDPASHFVQGLVVSRVDANGRHTLRGTELAYHDLRSGTSRRKLPDAAAVRGCLQDVFGIALAQLPELDARLQQMKFE